MKEQNTVLFYTFYLRDVTEPIVVEALNKEDAVNFLRAHKRYLPSPVVGLHVSRPLFGITKKEMGGISYVWCGFENNPTGWMEESKFNFLSKDVIK